MLCTDENKEQLLSFLVKNKDENTFFIGDIENFSLEDDFIDVWKFETDGQISSVLLRYYKNYLISALNDNHLEEMIEIIANDKDCYMVSGLEYIVDKVGEFIQFKDVKKNFLARLNKSTFKGVKTDLIPKKATVENINELFEFQKGIEEFTIGESDRERFGKGIISGTGRMYYVKEDGKIVSSAGITAENSKSGMIVGVATDEDYRGKGYAKACVMAICKEMIDSDKSVTLFYNNPNAGKLYKAIGFVDIGKWYMGIVNVKE